jgi:2,4-dienoyl-CoA reductase-like NADH-dependent reductase (Old Yellow Enzyme family)
MPELSSPLLLPCGGGLPNRIAKSAMSEDLADRGNIPGERLFQLYRRWGKGGAGLLITGNVMIDRTALGEPYNVVVEDGKVLPSFSAWAKAAREGGVEVWPQLNHPGRQSPRMLSPVPVAPSAVAVQLPGKAFAQPRALSGPEIEALVDRFARAAALCKQAGFTGVQIHAAHGYLISQFLSPLSNLREDEWGGSPEKRRRFLMEVVRAVRAAVDPTFPVGVKLNSADFQRGGFSEEESMEVVECLEKEGVDLLEISGGTYENPATTGLIDEVRASSVAREAYFLSYARRVRARTRMPLMLTGGFRTRLGMETALNEGIDVVGMARPLALEPELPRAILEGRGLESRMTPRTTGIRALDTVVEMLWYGHQIYRMSVGKDPDPDAWALSVILSKVWRSIRGPAA